MKDLRPRILEAALQVFMRYGVARTRMSDIASEAGVVRQTLYSFFDNKDDILCATIRFYSEKSLIELKQVWSTLDRLEDQLDAFYESAIVSSYRMISASTDARDMIGGYNEKGKAETKRSQTKKIEAWTELLTRQMPNSRQNGTASVAEIAEYIVLSGFGVRDQADSEAQLATLLKVQKSGVIALINEAKAKA